MQILGDKRKWFSFSEEQLKTSGSLIAALQKKYSIRGSAVLAYADRLPSIKSDPGPMYDWKKIFEEYNAGY